MPIPHMVFHFWKGFSLCIVDMTLFIKKKRSPETSGSADFQSKSFLFHHKSCHGLFFVKEVFLKVITKNVNFIC